jgi:Cu/Ag efflux protein CusF
MLAFAVGASTPGLAEMVKGEVKKVDVDAGKITIRHDPIKSLQMDAMTMVFKAKDEALVKSVKTGDKISFEAERVNGQLTVTKIDKVK